MNTKASDPRPRPHAQGPKRPADLLERHDHDDSGHLDEDELIDMESDQSFPASDPPGWTLGTTKGQ
jgi:hypothetical protein